CARQLVQSHRVGGRGDKLGNECGQPRDEADHPNRTAVPGGVVERGSGGGCERRHVVYLPGGKPWRPAHASTLRIGRISAASVGVFPYSGRPHWISTSGTHQATERACGFIRSRRSSSVVESVSGSSLTSIGSPVRVSNSLSVMATGKETGE